MNCMKCGREIEEPQVFCPECLEEMAQYPVKPGTVVQLPRQLTYIAPKKPVPRRKPAVPLEDQVKSLRKWVKGLAWALAVTVALLTGSGFMLHQSLVEPEPKVLPGQNYTSATPTTPGSNVTRR